MIDFQEPKLKARDERAVRKVLVDLQRRHPEKLLTAEDVVEEAKKSNSPLHDLFDWDVEKAAMQHWLNQARSLIRHCTVTMPEDKAEAKVPKYVSLGTDRKKPGGGYRETSQVLSNKELMSQLEETAKKDIDGVLRRYEMLKGLVARVRKAAGIKK